MIQENTQYGKHENVTIVEFGTGDILMQKAKRAEGLPDNELMLVQDVPKVIGTETDEYVGKSSDDMPRPSVVLVFNKPESITAMIHTLVEMQKTMFN